MNPAPFRHGRLARFALAIVAVLMVTACGDSGPAKRAPVVVLGVDGAEWNVINDMIADGELPHFKQLRDEAAHGYLLNPGPAISPIVWTTFATGRFPRDHGILAHVHPYAEGGQKRAVSSDLRQVPALWNIASHYGFDTHLVGYFVSHPPERINGVMVSPRAMGSPDDSIRPQGALDLSEPEFAELYDESVQADLLDPYFGWTFDRAQVDDPASPYHDAANIVADRNIDRRILADEFLHRAAMDLSERPADLFITYTRLVDYMSHSLWIFYDDSDFETKPTPEQQALFGEALKESYRFTDRVLGDILAAWDGKANILVISDHGFAAASSRKRAGPTKIKHLTGDHIPNGVILATGPDIQPGEIRGMTVMDVAPTVAALMGMPLSGEMPGEIAFDLLRPGLLEAFPIQTVTSYADVQVVRDEQELDLAAEAEDMTTLQGLGYIGEGVDLTAEAASGVYDFWASSDDLVTSNLVTEVLFFLHRGDIDSARLVSDELATRRPDAVPLFNARLVTKYLNMQAQLPEGIMDDGPFLEFFGGDPRKFRRESQVDSVSDDA